MKKLKDVLVKETFEAIKNTYLNGMGLSFVSGVTFNCEEWDGEVKEYAYFDIKDLKLDDIPTMPLDEILELAVDGSTTLYEKVKSYKIEGVGHLGKHEREFVLEVLAPYEQEIKALMLQCQKEHDEIVAKYKK